MPSLTDPHLNPYWLQATHWPGTTLGPIATTNYQITGSTTSGFTLKHVDPLEHFTRTLERLNEALATL